MRLADLLGVLRENARRVQELGTQVDHYKELAEAWQHRYVTHAGCILRI